MKFVVETFEGAEHITAELEPGELTYNPATDVATFTISLPGHVIGHEHRPREWMAMARAMVEGVRAARESRAASL